MNIPRLDVGDTALSHLRDEVLAQDGPLLGARHQVLVRQGGVGGDDPVQAPRGTQRPGDGPRVHVSNAQHPLCRAMRDDSSMTDCLPPPCGPPPPACWPCTAAVGACAVTAANAGAVAAAAAAAANASVHD